MDVATAAKIIGCHETTVTRLVRAKKIKAEKIPLKQGDAGFGRYKHKWKLHSGSVKAFAKKKPRGQGRRGVKRKTTEK